MPLVEDLMNKEPFFVDAGVSCVEAARLMTEKRVGALVVNKGGKPVGIVTERDFLNKITAKGKDASNVRLSEVMSSPLVTIGPKANVREAARLMIEKNIRRLVVVENEKTVGIMTIRDITRLLVSSIAEWNEARVTLA